MKPTRKIKMKIVTIIISLALFCQYSYALSCYTPSSFFDWDETVASAPIIFMGKALSFTPLRYSDGDEVIGYSEFKVLDTFKGILPRKVKLETYPVQVGKKYIFPLHFDDNFNLKTYSSACSGDVNVLLDTKQLIRDKNWRYHIEERGGSYEHFGRLEQLKAYNMHIDILMKNAQKTLKKGEKPNLDFLFRNNEIQKLLLLFEKYNLVNGTESQQRIAEYIYLLGETGRVDDAIKVASESYKKLKKLNQRIHTEFSQSYAWIMAKKNLYNEIEDDIKDFAQIFYDGRTDKNIAANIIRPDLTLYESEIYNLDVSNSKIEGELGSYCSFLQDISIKNFEIKGNMEVLLSDFYDFIIEDSHISRAEFYSSFIYNVSIKRTSLSNAEFDFVNISESVFQNVDFSHSHWDLVQITKSEFNNVDFSGSDLSGIYTYDENGIDFSNVKFDEHTIWPKNMNLTKMILEPEENRHLEFKISGHFSRVYTYGYWAVDRTQDEFSCEESAKRRISSNSEYKIFGRRN